MKITQKLFKEKLMSNKSIFLGRTKTLYAPDEVECAIDKIDPTMSNQRKVEKVISSRLVFSGGSELDLRGCIFYEYALSFGTVLVCDSSWVVMYYLLVK